MEPKVRESLSHASLRNSLRQSQTNIGVAPRDEADIPTELRVRMGEGGKWISGRPTGNFVKYLPQDEAVAAGRGAEYGALDVVESQRVVDLLNRELSRLLKLKDREFWSEVATDDSLGEFLDSYLQFRSRWYDFLHHQLEGRVAGVIVGDLELSRRVFMVLYRISLNNDLCASASAGESLSKKEHETLLQQKKLLNLPKLLDICSIYFHDNPEHTRLLVTNAVKSQPMLLGDLSTLMPRFLNILHTLHLRCGSLLGVSPQSFNKAQASTDNCEDHGKNQSIADILEVVDFTNDAVISLDAFISAFEPAAIHLCCPSQLSYGSEDSLTALARLHDSLLPLLQQGFVHILQGLDGRKTLHDRSSAALSFSLLSTRIVKFGWTLLESCYLNERLFSSISPMAIADKMFPANVEDPAVRGDILFHTIREIITHIPSHSHCAEHGTFIQKLEKHYGILGRISNLQLKGWVSLDEDQQQYLSLHMSVPHSSKPDRNDSDTLISSMNNGLKKKDENLVLESKISQIKDIFPEYGKGFISACLDVYNHSTEEVIQRILEGSLSEGLSSLDRSVEEVQQPKYAQSLRREDKGKGAAVECTLAASSNINTSSGIEKNSAEPSSLSSSLSAYGRYTRKSKVESPVRDILDNRGGKDSIKAAVLASQLEYEDEYDDSFDELGLGIIESVEEADILGDRFGSSLEFENVGKGKGSQKPRFFVKDGKNYSYKVPGSVAVSNARDAAMLHQAQKEMIHGLGRGGNFPYGPSRVTTISEEPQVIHTKVEKGGYSHISGGGHGWGKLMKEGEQVETAGGSNSAVFRGKGQGRGRGNHHRKDRAMKKHFVGISGC